MEFKKQLSRRTFLRGLGVSIALPWLETMGPLTNWATAATKGMTGQVTPNRMAFLYVPNGKIMEEWTPQSVGADFELTNILKPLVNIKDKTLVLSGLTADKARANGDGGGDHARAMAAFLTGAQPRKTSGTDIHAGISVDQAAATQIGNQTRIPSLELGIDKGYRAGNCDSGYSCVYSSTMAWKSATQPLPKEVNPKLAFERLFSVEPNAERTQLHAERKSILDFVRQDSKDLIQKVSGNDARKLDEYFSSIRDIEQRIESAEKFPPIENVEFTAPDDIPADFQEHVRLMMDLIVLAFQTDVTRIATFVVANEGSNKTYPAVNVTEGHHNLSHHGGDEDKIAKILRINIFHTEQLAYFLEKLDAIPEGEGTLLDNSMIVYGSGNADGNRHSHHDLPIIVAGNGCGTLKSGRHIKYPKETPLNNLWLSLLNRMDVNMQRLGDSTGSLKDLS
ncbi:hypothetical protein C6497_16240 [Candidatus Poribacteria bacterium]|nr:MAG: hypothetical protein C6497_16240 [Candidatus Poribacteria bacterium]